MGSVRVLVAVGIVVAALVVAAPLSASPPTTGTGTGVIQAITITPVGEAGGNVFQERRLLGVVTGALDGTFDEEVRGVINRSGVVTFQGTIVFTGTVEGCGSGTVVLGLSGRGTAGVPVTEANVRAITDPRNTLTVHGAGTVSQVGPLLTYEVRYNC